MRELVGCCKACEKEVYCLDGFLNGVVTDKSGTIYCFECFDANEQDEKNQTCAK